MHNVFLEWVAGRSLLLLSAVLVVACTMAEARLEVPPEEQQIAAAVQPLPEHMQDQARVLGYDEDGELATLREGEGFECLADDPEDDEQFHVACYAESLEPFMARGRTLRADGHSRNEVREIRRQEILDGELEYPDGPAALYSLTGEPDGFDYENGVLRQARPLYVVYVPFATGEETGLPTTPAGPGIPWLMDEGEPWAHIMYSAGHPVGEDVAE